MFNKLNYRDHSYYPINFKVYCNSHKFSMKLKPSDTLLIFCTSILNYEIVLVFLRYSYFSLMPKVYTSQWRILFPLSICGVDWLLVPWDTNIWDAQVPCKKWSICTQPPASFESSLDHWQQLNQHLKQHCELLRHCYTIQFREQWRE